MGKNNKFTISKSNQDIKLDVARRITDWDGCILNKEILKKLKVDAVVRISLHVSKKSNYRPKLESDSPYVNIQEIKGKYILGKILDMYRHESENHYPLRTGEHLWFQPHNVIEIPLLQFADAANAESRSGNAANAESSPNFNNFRTNEYVCYTGPLETVNYDSESSDESEDSESDSGNDNSESIDMDKFDCRIPLLRKRKQ